MDSKPCFLKKSDGNFKQRLIQVMFNYILFLKKRFDDNKNNIGTLCTKLSTEASAVQGVGFLFIKYPKKLELILLL